MCCSAWVHVQDLAECMLKKICLFFSVQSRNTQTSLLSESWLTLRIFNPHPASARGAHITPHRMSRYASGQAQVHVLPMKSWISLLSAKNTFLAKLLNEHININKQLIVVWVSLQYISVSQASAFWSCVCKGEKQRGSVLGIQSAFNGSLTALIYSPAPPALDSYYHPWVNASAKYNFLQSTCFGKVSKLQLSGDKDIFICSERRR